MDIEEIKRRVDIVAVVGSYVPLKRRGAELVGRCPFHSPDNNPSFYVVPQKSMYVCFSCGAGGDVINFLMEHDGLDFKTAVEKLNGGSTWPTRTITQEAKPLPDRLTRKPPRGAGTPNMTLREFGDPSAVWTYRDGLGDVLGYVARYEAASRKEFRCWTFGARGDQPPAWGVGSWSKPRPLYGLDRLNNRAVLVVEGEKAADAADALLGASYAAVTWPGGAQAWKHAEWEYLRGRRVLLWPDADEPGVKAMHGLASLLADPKGLGCKVRIVDHTDVPEGHDLADFQAGGATTADVIAYAKARVRSYVHVAQQQSECRDSDTTDTKDTENPAPPPVSGPSSPDSGPPPQAAVAGPDNATVGASEVSGTTQDEAAPHIPASPENRSEARKQAKTRKNRPSLAVVGGDGSARQPDPDDDPIPHELSEIGIAAEFVERHAGKYRTVHEWAGKHKAMWMTWDGRRWLREPTRVSAFQDATALASSVKHWRAAQTMTELSKIRFESAKFVTAFLDVACYAPEFVASPDIWDCDPFLLGTPAGTVDLKTGKLIEADPDQFITRQTSVAPEPGPHPLFDDVIRRASGGDCDIAAYLWRWLGYFLTGDVSQECFLYLWGKPQCGKTTLVEAIADIIGDASIGGYAAKCDIELFTESKLDRGSDRMAHLAGARFAYAGEMEEGKNFKAALLKLATGGDRLDGRFLYSEKFTFKATHKLCIFGNEMLHMRSADAGLKRRLHLLEYRDEFIVTDEEVDSTFKERLKSEYPAILDSMIRAAVEYIDIGSLGRPERIALAVDDYVSSEDIIGAWISENLERVPGAKTLQGDAYQDFKRWADASGEYAMSSKRFTQAMRQRGFEPLRSGGRRYLIGLELRHKPDAQGAASAYYNRD